MSAQKDYIEHFRREAEAIVEQQISELEPRYMYDEHPQLQGATDHDRQLKLLEERLHTTLHEIIGREKLENNTELQQQLMSFYQDYLQDFSKRING